MITIIKHGTKKIIECNICGCVFTYEPEDTFLKKGSADEVAYKRETFVFLKNVPADEVAYKRETFVACPECTNNVYIEGYQIRGSALNAVEVRNDENN